MIQMHISDLELRFSHKVCFTGFNTQIHLGDRIGIIGRNGCGKSTLLHMLRELVSSDGEIGYVPQLIDDFSDSSGGEKVRLSLAVIAAKTPKLLILDEITNNLDLETKQHVIEVLRDYPGAMIVISHEEAFLDAINVMHRYEIVNGTCC